MTRLRVAFRSATRALVLAGAAVGCAGPEPTPDVERSGARAGDRAVYSCAVDGERQPLTPRAMFDRINALRTASASHVRYDGYPWVGSYTHATTWPLTMKWDDALALKAQAEAARLAGAGTPAGTRFRHQMFGLFGDRTEDMWLRGLDTDEYEIAARSRVATQPDARWNVSGNGTMRLAVLHQTGTGAHRFKSRLGIAKACERSGDAWWVMIFAD